MWETIKQRENSSIRHCSQVGRTLLRVQEIQIEILTYRPAILKDVFRVALSMSECGSSPHGPVARRPTHALCAPSLGPSHQSPVLLKKFQIALRLRPLTSSGSKKKDPR
jgi:hypothetical protein